MATSPSAAAVTAGDDDIPHPPVPKSSLKITDKIAALPDGSTYFSLEFFPPKTSAGFTNLTTRLTRMALALRPLFVTVTWGAGGSTAAKSLELAALTQRQLDLTTCLHLTCTNMSRALVDEALAEARQLGVRNILALRGDPPRRGEYEEVGDGAEGGAAATAATAEFQCAKDLVRYIRQAFGDWFSIGVAGYPEGHVDQSCPERQEMERDLPWLREKVEAGADFIVSQLFFDTGAFERWERKVKEVLADLGRDVPIVPGLMPVQSYAILRRVTKLSHAKVPPEVMERLDAVRGDDEAVKEVGVEVLTEMVKRLREVGGDARGRRGFHFYTLNLEKAVAQVLERSGLIPQLLDEDEDEQAVIVVERMGEKEGAKRSKRRPSAGGPRNKVVVSKRSGSTGNAEYEAMDHEAGVPRDVIPATRADTLAISEGEGGLGREATWDDFPNGRWGDARSPAFGEIDGYGPSLHVPIPQALKLWGYPVDRADITAIFRRHLLGELDALPWSEESLSPETLTIRDRLLALIDRGWWTVASQPAVNSLPSTDPIFGWGPRNGFVWQKPFVEFFIPAPEWARLRARLDAGPARDEFTYYAGDASGAFQASDPDAVNPVTWGTFAGKEVVTPTIIERESFAAWVEEAFELWREWEGIYRPGTPSARLLGEVRGQVWLVNVIAHRYTEPDRLWEFLAEE